MTGSTVALIFLLYQLLYGGVVPGAAAAPAVPAPNPDRSEAVRDPNVVCRPARWHDPIVFITLNYIVHVFTTRSIPGETTAEFIAFRLVTLFMPYAQLRRVHLLLIALPTILRARRRKDELELAKWAGALCVVAPLQGIYRPDSVWKPSPDEVYHTTIIRRLCFWEVLIPRIRYNLGNARYQPKENNSVRTCQFPHHAMLVVDVHDRAVRSISEVHGLVNIPAGYTLQVVPVSATVNPIYPSSENLSIHHIDNSSHDTFRQKPQTINLSKTLNPLKSIAAIAQLFAAVYALWRARGTQLDTYGYAAYSLTVIPFALLSLLNLLVSLAIPEYPMLYLVRNTFMDKLKNEGHIFKGIVGKLEASTDQELSLSQHGTSDERELATLPISTIQQNQLAPESDSSNKEEQSKALFELLESKVSVTGRMTLSIVNGEPVATCMIESGASKLSVEYKIDGGPSGLNPAVDIYLEPCGKFKSWTTVCIEKWPGTNNSLLSILFMSFFLVLLAVPFIMIFCLTGFAPKQSTVLQRMCIMFWLTTQCGGPRVSRAVKNIFQKRQVLDDDAKTVSIVFVAMWLMGGIGMFTVVWMMILESDICTVI